MDFVCDVFTSRNFELRSREPGGCTISLKIENRVWTSYSPFGTVFGPRGRLELCRMVFDFVWCDVVVDAAAGGHPLRRGHVGRGSLGALVVAGEVSSNSRRLSVTSATSLAEMFVLMMPLPTHGSYCTSRTSPGRRLAFTFTSWFAVVAVQRLPGREEAWPARRCPRRIAGPGVAWSAVVV